MYLKLKSFAHHFVIYWLFQNGENENQHQGSHQRETIPDNFVFFFFFFSFCFVLFCFFVFVFCFVYVFWGFFCFLFLFLFCFCCCCFSKIGKAKKSIGWAKYMYVCAWDMCWRNFCNFSLVTKKSKNVKSRSKIALLFKWAPFWNLISKKDNNYVFLK